MRGDRAVVGVFSYLDQALQAIRDAQAAGLDYLVYSPCPNHEIEELTYPQKSPVRFFSMAGALCGLVGGFALTIWCSLDWPMRVSAKDVVSMPAFVAIGYECAILIGGLATLLAVLHLCRLPWVLKSIGYDPRFSQDKYGVVVGCGVTELESVCAKLRAAGADEVQVREGF